MNKHKFTARMSKTGSGAAQARNLKLIAFYLTQFHPIPENDTWWGKGFTEWTNVTKAEPLFEGHYQPHLPSDLGFYDLRVRATRHEQIRLAKEFGIDGFCYHYYWFSGKRLLEQPLNDMLADPESNMPFCLCWANENWTRRWDAAEHEVLIAQRYTLEDDLAFVQSLVPYLSDPRYIRIDDKPILIIYRPQHLPDARKSAQIWRDYCRDSGIGDIHICAALTHGNSDYLKFGFDSGVEFPPHNQKCPNLAHKVAFRNPFLGYVGEFQTLAQHFLDRSYADTNVFRCVFPGWDNTARAGHRAFIALNSTPENYEYWLSKTIDKEAREFPDQERLVFINAWNEWAEGCHLEPDRRYGLEFLKATNRAKRGESLAQGFLSVDAAGASGRPPRTLLGDIRELFRYHGFRAVGIIAARLRAFPRLRKMLKALFGQS